MDKRITTKKAVGNVIIISLILFITIVTAAATFNWYSNFQLDVNNKVGRKLDKVEIEGVNFINDTNVEVVVRNKGSLYYIVENLSIGNSSCDMPQNDIIEENAITVLNVNCDSILKGVYELVIFTDLNVLHKRVIKNQ